MGFITKGDNVPYIKGEKRDKLDPILNELVKEINQPGDLNYCIYKLICMLAKINTPSYRVYSALLTELECCKLEFYRKKVAPYEDKKLKENGDVAA